MRLVNLCCYFIFFLLLQHLFSCQNNSAGKATKPSGISMVDSSLIPPTSYADPKMEALAMEVLKKQLREGANLFNEVTDVPKEPYSLAELQVSNYQVELFLRENRYGDLENEFFANKIAEIFGIKLNLDGSNQQIYVNLFDPCATEPNYHSNNGIDYNGFFIVSPANFISEFYYLPEFVDYQANYPGIMEFEEGLPNTYFSKYYDSEIEMEKWSDLESRNYEQTLSDRRKRNQETVLHRNRFLFDGDENALDWLLEHDSFFMGNLVKRFGWTNNKILLAKVIEDNRYSKYQPEDFGSLFWKKNCDGRLNIHSNTFKLLQQQIKPENKRFSYVLADIRSYLEYALGYQTEKQGELLTEAQKLEVLAHLVYFAEQYKYKTTASGHPWSYERMMGRFRFMLNPQQLEILQAKNYFGLPKFKEWWDKADYDEYYASGDYEGPWGRDNQPLTESEWRKQLEERKD